MSFIPILNKERSAWPRPSDKAASPRHSESMKAYKILKIGRNSHGPRVWLSGKYLLTGGFLPGRRYHVTTGAGTLTLAVHNDGSRVISSKDKGDGRIPVIDLNSSALLQLFEGLTAVRVIVREGKITLLPLASEARRKERLQRLLDRLSRKCGLLEGSLSHGGGILSSAIHEGLAAAGIGGCLAFANEIREDLLDQSQERAPNWTPHSVYLQAPMQELFLDEWAMGQLPKVDILSAGLPCSGASRAGRSKNKISMPEQHPDVGHLFLSALAIIARVNPALVVFENVETYFTSSATGAVIRSQLRDMGYRVHERLMSGQEFNALEDRKRMCLVAVTEGIPFDFADLDVPAPVERHLSEILEEFPEGDPRWSPMAYLVEKEQRDREAGKGFAMQTFGPEDTRISTITKGYAKIRSTDPKIKHPSKAGLFRQLTPTEHARAKGIDERMVDGLSQTAAHEMLGQAVIYAPFREVGALIGRALKKFAESAEAIAVPAPAATLFRAAA